METYFSTTTTVILMRDILIRYTPQYTKIVLEVNKLY
jgi:hypothetical protein